MLIHRVECDRLLQTDSFGHLTESVAEAHKLGFFVASAPPTFTVSGLADYRGRQQALIDLAANPDLAHRVIDIALGNAIEYGRALVRCGVDAI